MNRKFLAWTAVLLLVGCSEDAPAPKTQQKPREPVPKAPATPANPLLDSKNPAVNQTAPAEFKVKFVTSKGDIVVQVTRSWAPKGADRFYNLVKNNYYDEVRFFRVIRAPRPFMAQFGIHGDPKVAAAWREASIEDDPVTQSNTRGMLSYAMAGPNTRTTQIFINYGDNSRLDTGGFSPFGKVTEGMDVVDKFHADYGESPDQTRIQYEGNAYLGRSFPNLDYIKTARVIQ